MTKLPDSLFLCVKHAAYLSIVVILAFSACGDHTNAQSPQPNTAVSSDNSQPNTSVSPDEKEVVEANTAFALDLYSHLGSRPGNLFLSPYSISNALMMTYGGAGGGTAEQMARVLHQHLPKERVHPAFGRINDSLSEGAKSGAYSLCVANALWGQTGHPFLSSFIGLSANQN
jgi:serpin B